jgi:hypothetical protein
LRWNGTMADKNVARRQVRYATFDDVIHDATRLSNTKVTTVGNWTQGQIYDHLAKAYNQSIDGMKPMPAPMRWLFTLLMKKRFLNKGLPAGFKTMSNLQPPAVETADGLASLTQAVDRLKQEPNRAMHPVFGNITREEWDQFHLRHAELHMSFLVEQASDS